MNLSGREEDLLEAMLEYAEELARIDDSDPVEMLEEEGFPEEAMDTVKQRSGLAVETELESLKQRGLLDEEERTEKRTVTDENSYGFRKEKVRYLRFSRELLDWMRNR
ncbi:MAG: hypothetical protein ABEJ98_01130 [Candidatus Nanohaloarchaea archaeon]